MTRRPRTPTLAAAAPELVYAIEKAHGRRTGMLKKLGGVKVRPPTRDAERRWKEELRPTSASPEQCLLSAGWYLAEAVCLGFTHERRASVKEPSYTIPCSRCLEAGLRAVKQSYEKGVRQ